MTSKGMLSYAMTHQPSQHLRSTHGAAFPIHVQNATIIKSQDISRYDTLSLFSHKIANFGTPPKLNMTSNMSTYVEIEDSNDTLMFFQNNKSDLAVDADNMSYVSNNSLRVHPAHDSRVTHPEALTALQISKPWLNPLS